MPLISLQSVCNYHWSSMNWVVNDNTRKYLFSPFQGSKHYLVLTLTFVFRVPKYNYDKILSSFFIQKEENMFSHRPISSTYDTLEKCHTFIYHHHWLPIFFLSSLPFNKIITTGMLLNADNSRTYFKIASFSIQWWMVYYHFKNKAFFFYILIWSYVVTIKHNF